MNFRLLFTVIVLLLLASQVLGSSVGYEYDELDRLHIVTLENGQKITYQYDEIGNMVSRTGTASKILSVSKNGIGNGTITSSVGGVSCGSSCTASITSGTTVTLTATPDGSSLFAGWTGACSGMGTCTLPMNENNDVTATFNVGATGGVETGASGWSPQSLPIGVAVNGYTGSYEGSFVISKTLNLRPGLISIAGNVMEGSSDAAAWYGLKINGTEVNLWNNTYNSSYSGYHLVELYVYAFDAYGDEATSELTWVSIPVN